jgi:3-isopropylmalate/(R)-2-methylmalate dehydratase large subunit
VSAATLFDKIWQSHVIRTLGDDRALIHIDRHLLHEATSRDAFDGLRRRQRLVKSLGSTFAVIDHDPSTRPGRTWESFPPAVERILAIRENCRSTGIELIDIPRSRYAERPASDLSSLGASSEWQAARRDGPA